MVGWSFPGARWRAAGAALVVLVALACTSPSPPAPAQRAAPQAAEAAPSAADGRASPAQRYSVRMAYSSLSGANLGLWVTQDGGYFTQEGVDVTDFVLIEGGTLAVQALVGGDVQFAFAGTTGLIAAELQGADLVMIAGASTTLDFALLANPEVRTAEDVRGRRVGISRFGSQSDFAARLSLQRLGLDPDRDVTILQIGGTAARLSAMQSRTIDVAPEIAPVLLTARKMGLNDFVDLATSGVPYQVGAIATARARLSENPDLVRRVVRAYLAGIHRLKTDKELGVAVAGRYTHTDDRETLEETWQHYALASIPAVPYVTDEGLALMLEELGTQDRAVLSVPPSRFYENRFLREAEESGFVRALYGR